MPWFGTVQNEGASKGLLVTTSGYGKASFQFAEGKPLELLSGSNLPYLLAEHAGIEAKIEAPDHLNELSQGVLGSMEGRRGTSSTRRSSRGEESSPP